MIKKSLGPGILHSGRQARIDAVNYAVENHQHALRQLQLISVRGDHGRFPTIERNEPPLPVPLMDGHLDVDTEQGSVPAGPNVSDVESDDDSSLDGNPGPSGGLKRAATRTSGGDCQSKRKRRTLEDGNPSRCVSRLVALLQALAGSKNLQVSASHCFTFELILE